MTMRAKAISVTGNGVTRNSNPVVVSQYTSPGNIGLSFKTTGSTTGFKVQYSLDDPFGVYATDYNTNGQWFDHASMTTMTAGASGSILTPVRAVRLQADTAGTDTGTLTVVQEGK